jgi:hypothetical protein
MLALLSLAACIASLVSAAAPLSVKPQALSGWCERLSDTTFTEQVMSPGTHTLVAFVAPWCKQCTTLEPVYDALCRTFAFDSDRVFIATMQSSTGGADEEVGNAYDVASFPAIKLYGATVEDNPLQAEDKGMMVDVDTYTGPVDIDALVRFVNERVSGTSRLPALPVPSLAMGRLDPSFGLVRSMDILVSRYYEKLHLTQEDGPSPTAALKAVLSDAKRLQDMGEVGESAFNHPQAGPAGRYYLKMLDKVDQGGQEAIKTERGRLKRLLSAGPSTFAAGKARAVEVNLNM